MDSNLNLDEGKETEQPVNPAEPPSNEAEQPASRLVGAASGVLAAAAALATGELVGALGAPQPGPVLAVANRVIDLAPTWFVEFGKNLFGLNDKPALVVGTVLISLVLGSAFGLIAAKRAAAARIGFVGFGLLGLLAIGTDSQGTWIFALACSAAAVAAGLFSLRFLLSRASTEAPRNTSAFGAAISPTNPPVSRRGFLGAAGLVGVAGAAAAAGASQLRGRASAEIAREAVTFAPIEGADALVLPAESAPGSVAATPGISSLVTPNDDFYLIDTAIVRPQVDPANWSLTISGMVDSPLEFSYDELLDRATTIAPVTLSCVSNEVGGGLVGNAVWRGVPLADLLEEAGVQDGATQVASSSVDGWTCGFPTEAAFDGRTALVAVGMNDEPLPVKHGFPARLVVSGLYGYVSATKWLSNIELTTWEGFDGFWVPRGWSKVGPVKTQSRIDTPNDLARVNVGETTAIAGVAWAPDTGIERVEVRIDEGPWEEARLGETLGSDSWLQWMLPWTPTEGQHRIEVRATDSSGYTQTEDRAQPRPDGATGWHRISVNAF